MLALLAERASGADSHQLVHTLVCEPAGMVDTAILRSDELPGRAARGYLSADGLRTNVFHLPVLGNGDGGIYWKRTAAYRSTRRSRRAASTTMSMVIGAVCQVRLDAADVHRSNG